MSTTHDSIGVESTAERIAVLIVDDHAMLAAALSTTLDEQPEFNVVGVSATVAQARQMFATHHVDVALIDLRLADEDGAALVREVRQSWPAVRILVVSAASDAETVRRALDAGCHGYLLKGQQIEALIHGIIRVAANEPVFSPEIRGIVTRNDESHGLTGRELELLRMLALGWSTAEVASTMFISEHTVRNHVKHVLRKMNVHSRAEAVATAIQRRLVDISASA